MLLSTLAELRYSLLVSHYLQTRRALLWNQGRNPQKPTTELFFTLLCLFCYVTSVANRKPSPVQLLAHICAPADVWLWQHSAASRLIDFNADFHREKERRRRRVLSLPSFDFTIKVHLDRSSLLKLSDFVFFSIFSHILTYFLFLLYKAWLFFEIWFISGVFDTGSRNVTGVQQSKTHTKKKTEKQEFRKSPWWMCAISSHMWPVGPAAWKYPAVKPRLNDAKQARGWWTSENIQVSRCKWEEPTDGRA